MSRQVYRLYPQICSKYVQIKNYSQTVNSFEVDFEENHIPITSFQRTLLNVGASAVSLFNPYRADMIACLGETSGLHALKYMLSKMEESEEGTQILKERPRINTGTIDLEYLKTLPEDTIGKSYFNFLDHNKVTPDSRNIVQFVDDIELAYVIQRYREVHDMVHAVLKQPTHMLGEVTVKWVEAIQTKLPMCVGAAIFGPLRLKPKHRELYLKYHLPWAVETGKNAEFLLNIYYEKRWEQPLSEFYSEVNIKPLVIKKKQSKTNVNVSS